MFTTPEKNVHTGFTHDTAFTVDGSSPSDGSFFGERVFGLIIGINMYPNLPAFNLRSAVRDAQIFEAFLAGSFHEATFVRLYDTEATRSDIIDALKNLGQNPAIQQGDAIVIYFSGHGARCNKPIGPCWDNWTCIDSKIELICPSDIEYFPPEDTPMEGSVCGIPDRTLAVLLNELSAKKGNNITVIMDCCHSAGATRSLSATSRYEDDDEPLPRVIDLPFVLPDDCDRNIWDVDGASCRSACVPKPFIGHDSDSHVLLAACARDETSWETKHGAIFTNALLDTLKTINKEIDYATLIRRIDLSKKVKLGYTQTPCCDGVNSGRVIFQTYSRVGSSSFISGQIDNKNIITINAGRAQDIWDNAVIGLFATNHPWPADNPQLAMTTASSIGASKTVLAQPEKIGLRLPPFFYAKLLERNPLAIIRVYARENTKLEKILARSLSFHSFSDLPQALAGITFESNEAKADVTVSFENEGQDVAYYMNVDVKGLRHSVRVLRTTSTTRPKDVLRVLQAAARFMHCLRMSSQSERPGCIRSEDISMELRRLKVADLEDEYMLVPEGPDFLNEGTAIIHITGETAQGMIWDARDFGFTLRNRTNLYLHPCLVAFEVSELSIKICYAPAVTNTKGHQVGHLLRPYSEFPVGYGDSGAQPRGFRMLEGTKSDISYFKLFVTEEQSDFQFLEQESPFDCSRHTEGNEQWQLTMPETWGSILAAVLQYPSIAC